LEKNTDSEVLIRFMVEMDNVYQLGCPQW
jgi:hypothetical protein